MRVTEEDLEHVRAEVPLATRLSGEFSAWNMRFKNGTKVFMPGFSGTNVEFADMRNIIATEGGREQRKLRERLRVIFGI